MLSRTIVLTNELLTLQVFNGDVQGEVPVRVLGCHPVLEDGEAFYELSLERAEDDIVLPQRTSHAATAMPSPQR